MYTQFKLILAKNWIQKKLSRYSARRGDIKEIKLEASFFMRFLIKIKLFDVKTQNSLEFWPRWVWFSAPTPLWCKCQGTASSQRPSPARPAAWLRRWFCCGAVSSWVESLAPTRSRIPRCSCLGSRNHQDLSSLICLFHRLVQRVRIYTVCAKSVNCDFYAREKIGSACMHKRAAQLR